MTLPIGIQQTEPSLAQWIRLVALATEAGEHHGDILYAVEKMEHGLFDRGAVDAAGRRLLELRQMPYEDYLKTREWSDVKHFALQRAQHRCQVCSSADRVQVHHRTYDRRGREKLSDLTVLCEKHHELAHGLRDVA